MLKIEAETHRIVEGVHDVTDTPRAELEAAIRKDGGFLVREHYPFGVAPTYQFHLSDKIAVLFSYPVSEEKLCVELHVTSGEKFPETVKCRLREDWTPMGLDDCAWKRNNID